MSEPVDPNSPAPWQAADYQPPPPFAPPGYPLDPQAPPAAPGVGSVWVMGPDGVLFPAPPSLERPSRRRRNLRFVLAGLVVVAAAAIGAVVIFSGDSSSSHPRLAIPASFDGYSHVTGSTAQRVESTMRSIAGASASSASLFDAATIGSYAKGSGDQPRLIVVVLRTSEVPADVGRSPEDITHGLLAIAGSNVSDYSAGAHGGSSACADTQFGAVSEIMCAWSDRATTGLMVSVATPMTPSGLSGIELDLRDLVD